MGFFARGREPGDEDESRGRIESGGIPLAAEQRLQALGAEGALFTSGLSVNEFALLGRLGPRPLAQVMGASVVRTGLQLLPALPAGMNITVLGRYTPTTPVRNRFTDASPAQVRSYKRHTEVVCELDVLTKAWDTARRRALDRLAEEALHVGGDTVAGVHLRRGDRDLGQHTINYVVTGTAIRLQESPGNARPLLTDVSVQDLWRLHRAGYEPVGLLAASVVMFASPPRTTRVRRIRTARQSQQLGELSRAFQAARETLRARLQGQLADAHAVGAVGVEFSHSVHREKLTLASSLNSPTQRGWYRGRLGVPYYVSGRGEAERPGWVITMHVAGTAIRRRAHPPSHELKTAIRMGGQ